MTKKLRNIIALILVFVFMTPAAVKFFDGFLHQHDHFHCTVKNEAHFHEYHKKCPIPNYKLSFFSVEKHIQPVQRLFFLEEVIDNYNFIYHCNNLKYSFLLRAPPFLQIKY